MKFALTYLPNPFLEINPPKKRKATRRDTRDKRARRRSHMLARLAK